MLSAAQGGTAQYCNALFTAAGDSAIRHLDSLHMRSCGAIHHTPSDIGPLTERNGELQARAAHGRVHHGEDHPGQAAAAGNNFAGGGGAAQGVSAAGADVAGSQGQPKCSSACWRPSLLSSHEEDVQQHRLHGVEAHEAAEALVVDDALQARGGAGGAGRGRDGTGGRVDRGGPSARGSRVLNDRQAGKRLLLPGLTK